VEKLSPMMEDLEIKRGMILVFSIICLAAFFGLVFSIISAVTTDTIPSVQARWMSGHLVKKGTDPESYNEILNQYYALAAMSAGMAILGIRFWTSTR
jgi:hypothetical protein